MVKGEGLEMPKATRGWKGNSEAPLCRVLCPCNKLTEELTDGLQAAYIGEGQKGTPGRGRERKCHDRASLSRPLVFSLGPLTSLASSPLSCTSEDINGRGGGGPLTKCVHRFVI